MAPVNLWRAQVKPHELFLYVAIVSFLAFQNPADDGLPKPITKAEQARMDAANIPFRQGPSMELLINLADSGREDRREYYGRLLVESLKVTGPLIHERPAQGDFIYTASGNKTLDFGHDTYGYLPVKHAFGVLVPEKFLEAIGKDERGSEFPRGVPFRMLPKINP